MVMPGLRRGLQPHGISARRRTPDRGILGHVRVGPVVLYALRVIAPLAIAYALLQRGMRRGTLNGELYEQRLEALRLIALIGAALFGALAVVALVAAIVGR
jgi:hypothetical protein